MLKPDETIKIIIIVIVIVIVIVFTVRTFTTEFLIHQMASSVTLAASYI